MNLHLQKQPAREMTDLEMRKLCAEAMGLKVVEQLGELRFSNTQFEESLYEPLHDDVQAMALARKFPLEFELAVIEWCNHVRRDEPFDVIHYFCERIARRQREQKALLKEWRKRNSDDKFRVV